MVTQVRDSSYRLAIGGLILWSAFSLGLSFQNLSPILPIITEDYNISHTSGGILVGVVMIIQGTFCIPGAIVVGRFGLRPIYTVAWFMMGSLTLMALSPNFYGLLALRMIYALGTALLIPATGALIMQWFQSTERSIATSINPAGTALGFVVSLATVAPLSDILGWQRTLSLFGAVGVAGAFAWTFWGRTQEGTQTRAAPLTWHEIGDVLRTRAVLLSSFANAACLAQYIGLSAWLPTYYNESRGTSLAESGFMVSLLPFVGLFAVLLGGTLLLRIRSRRIFFILPGIMIGFGGMGSFVIDNTTVIYLSLVALGLGSWLYVPVLMILPMELPGTTPQKVAIVWGWIISLSGLSMFVSPLVIGAMRDAVGSFIPGFMLFWGLSWTMLVAGLLLPKFSSPSTLADDT